MSIVIARQNVPRRKRRSPRGGTRVVVRAQNVPKRRKRKNRNRSRKIGPRRGRAGNMHQYLKMIMDPENHVCRVPDLNCYKTAVYQIVENFELTTAADGATGFVFIPTPTTPTSTGFQHAIQGTSTEASGAQGIWLTQTAFAATSATSVGSSFRNWRPTAGCLCAEYIGDTQTDAGTICCLPLFRGQTAPIKMIDAVTLDGNMQFPLRNGCRMLFKPLDNGDLEFHGGGDPANPAIGIGGASYGMYSAAGVTTPASGSPVGERTPVAFCIMISGAKVSTKLLRIRAVFNYESVPNYASLGLFSTVSEPSNPSVVAQAMNVASTLPWGEAWQGLAGTAGRIGQELAQQAFAGATNMAGAALLNRIRSSGGWRTGRSLGWTSDFGGGDSLGLD